MAESAFLGPTNTGNEDVNQGKGPSGSSHGGPREGQSGKGRNRKDPDPNEFPPIGNQGKRKKSRAKGPQGGSH